MADSSALLGTFSRAHDDQGRRARWAAVATRISTALIVLAIGAICVFALRQLWIEWQTAAAQPLWAWLIGFMFALLLVLNIWNLQSKASDAAQTSALRQRVQVVRHALLAGDMRLAPLATERPEDGATARGEPLEIGRVRPLTDAQAKLLDICGAAALSLGFVAAFVAAVLIGLGLTQPQARNNPPLWLDFTSSVLALVLLAIGTNWAVRGLRAGRPQPVTVAELGIRWTRRASRPALPWSDARAFYTVSALASLGEWPGRRVYVLDSGEQVIAWQRSDSRFDHTREASDGLAGLIVSRTGLPLRDLTAAVNQVISSRAPGSPPAANAIRERMLAQLDNARQRGLNAGAEARLTALLGKLEPPDSADAKGVSDAVRQVLEAAGLQTAPPKSAAGKGCMLLLATVVAFALLAGTSWVVQQAQVRYLSGLPAQIHAETPLYADSLAAPDGTWLVSGATAHGVQYQGQSYHLMGTSGSPITSWTPATYGDVAVQVTTRQLGSTPSDGVGLIVRSDAARDDYVTFVVSPTDGGWTLWQYHPIDANAGDDWHYLAGGSSAAIHKGASAANTLLAITRGQDYVLYVNGAFVGSASDGDPDVYGNAPHVGTMTTPHQGRAGVYLADGATTGVFTNFAVYRLQPPSSLWYV
ncbi:MAG TPA: hypothetical protein VF116_04810 [Ktedonobacterales bacterium]